MLSGLIAQAPYRGARFLSVRLWLLTTALDTTALVEMAAREGGGGDRQEYEWRQGFPELKPNGYFS
jgi:hypothetical protein